MTFANKTHIYEWQTLSSIVIGKQRWNVAELFANSTEPLSFLETFMSDQLDKSCPKLILICIIAKKLFAFCWLEKHRARQAKANQAPSNRH